MKSTNERSHRGPRGFGSITVTAEQVRDYAALRDIGINLRDPEVRSMMRGLGVAMDAADGPAFNTLTTPSIVTPIQFLQAWLPGFVRVLTQARKIDTLIGITTAGSWEDESVVQGIMESTGSAEIYSDYGNIPLSSYNAAYEQRDIVRGEQGMQVGVLEEARAAKVKINTGAEKRISAAISLDILRNKIGFVGFNAASNRTYGILNDPSLLAYNTVPNGASASPLWSSKTFLEITKDLRVAFRGLRVQSGDNIDPKKAEITLAIATNSVDFLTVTSDMGISVQDWLDKNYPKTRVESVPEFNAANGGANVFYLYAEKVDDSASDDSRTFVQVVPAKFQLLGVEKRAKTYIEDYTNASAGVITKRPYAVYRATGI